MKTCFTVCLFVSLTITAFAQTTPQVIPLWQNGAPGFESRRNEPEQAKDYWVKSIHNPSLTVFLPPKEKATGAAVVIAPGGGHRELVFKAEGVEAAQYLNSIGVAAFALKYRLGREEGSPYSVQHAKEDGLRAMRLVRSRAKEFGIDPNRIGMMGFSAGGEVVSMTTFGATEGNPNATDVIDRASARPDFLVMIYPGPGGIPETIPANAPPAFLLVANDDNCCSGPVMRLLTGYRAAKIPVEAHLYGRGGHAFNMGNRSKLATLKGWPQRMADWMGDNNILTTAPRVTTASGLIYEIIREGTGAAARLGQTVIIHETLSLADGKQIFSSRDRNAPIKFVLGSNQVIAGVDEGVTGMKAGERRKLVVPPSLDGRKFDSSPYPPGSTLYYDIELVEIVK